MLALSPLLVFVALYLGTSLLAGDFYKMPISVAFLAASVYAVAISGGMPFKQRVATFSHGASTENVIQMLWIFVLAGAFAHTARETGCIDATVSLALQILPEQMLMAGLFLGACFISLSIGTSVGTIVALTPIATGIAQSTETSLPLLVALVVGGSLFGDNLSFISDTTIAATSTQGCRQSDKFKVNSFIVVPSALLTLLLYTFMTSAPRSTRTGRGGLCQGLALSRRIAHGSYRHQRASSTYSRYCSVWSDWLSYRQFRWLWVAAVDEHRHSQHG